MTSVCFVSFMACIRSSARSSSAPVPELFDPFAVMSGAAHGRQASRDDRRERDFFERWNPWSDPPVAVALVGARAREGVRHRERRPARQRGPDPKVQLRWEWRVRDAMAASRFLPAWETVAG